MGRDASYKTKQQAAIVSYLASLNGEHVTVSRIAEHFHNSRNSIGVTTIYRHLEKLVTAGTVRKYAIDGTAGACFQYVDPFSDPCNHFHLKCEACGRLIHLQCDFLSDLERHFISDHDFYLNPARTAFYGKCSACAADDR